MSDAPVVIADYDPAWPRRAAQLQAAIAAAAGAWIPRVEHIGSTSIPGCAAKPILDLLGGVVQLADAEAAAPALAALELERFTTFDAEIPFRRFYVQPGAVHFHVVETTHPWWQRHLDFRDWLRAHDAERDAYVALKRELAKRFRHDRAAYTEAKTAFITRIEHVAAESRTRRG